MASAVACLALLLLWTLVEQAVLALRLTWIARLAWLPLAERAFVLAESQAEAARVGRESDTYRSAAFVLDPARLRWPASFETAWAEYVKPASGSAPSVRLSIRASWWATSLWIRYAAAVRLSLHVEDGSSLAPRVRLRAHVHPAGWSYVAGVLAVILTVVFTFAAPHVAVGVGTLVALVAGVPLFRSFRDLRRRLDPVMDALERELSGEGTAQNDAPA